MRYCSERPEAPHANSGLFFFYNLKDMINFHDDFLDVVDAREMKLAFHIAKYMGRNNFSFPSNETLCAKTGWSLNTIQKYKKQLESKDIIESFPRFKKDGSQTSNGYIIKTDMISVFVNLKGKGDQREVQNTPTQDLGTPPTQELGNEVLKELTKEYVEKPKASIDNFAKEVVYHLNEKTERSYRATTKKTKSVIGARKKEGYTLEDFKRVIDFKVMEWYGSTMEKYLRPETLFGTKFESYLQEADHLLNITTSDAGEYSDQYQAYLDWVKEHFPRLLARIQFLSKEEFFAYKRRKYLDHLSSISKNQERVCLENCHRQFSENGNIANSYGKVWNYHCFKIKAVLKASTAI